LDVRLRASSPKVRIAVFAVVGALAAAAAFLLLANASAAAFAL
jgi:hypothetical protein